jgi:hypothetical protein
MGMAEAAQVIDAGVLADVELDVFEHAPVALLGLQLHDGQVNVVELDGAVHERPERGGRTGHGQR